MSEANDPTSAYLATERDLLGRLERLRHHIDDDKLNKDCETLHWGDVADIVRLNVEVAAICERLGLEAEL